MALIDGAYTLEFFFCSFGAFFLIIVSATENNARLNAVCDVPWKLVKYIQWSDQYVWVCDRYTHLLTYVRMRIWGPPVDWWKFCLLPQLLIWYIIINELKEVRTVLAKAPRSTALALPPVLVLQAKNVGHWLIRFHIIEHDYLDLKFWFDSTYMLIVWPNYSFVHLSWYPLK